MKNVNKWFFLGCLIFFACGQKQVKKEKAIVTDPFLEEAFNLLEKNSILSSSINWDNLREETYSKHTPIDSDSLRYSILKKVLKERGFKHHGFMNPQQVKDWRNKPNELDSQNTVSSLKYPQSNLLQGKIGHLTIPGFPTGDERELVKYASILQNQIKELADSGVDKWIVDLQKNFGGHMWPMIVGLGPLLGNEKLGGFVSSDSIETTSWFYKKGVGLMVEKDTILEFVKIEPKIDLLKNQKIAVLCSEKTASSGEAVLVAFMGKNNTKILGTKSAGYSTGNDMIEMSDGSVLIVTTSIYTDRNGNIYREGISPEILVEKKEDAFRKALDWLENNNY